MALEYGDVVLQQIVAQQKTSGADELVEFGETLVQVKLTPAGKDLLIPKRADLIDFTVSADFEIENGTAVEEFAGFHCAGEGETKRISFSGI